MTLNYGIIGNCKTVALVKDNSSIEWCCIPRFDSASVFGKILDVKNGGFFKIVPIGVYKIRQSYIKNTNILQTIFNNGKNKFCVIDYFPLYKIKNKLKQTNSIHRIVKVLKGKPKIRVIYDPRLDYSRGKTKLYQERGNLVANNKKDYLYLCSNLSYEDILNKKALTLKRNIYFVISYNEFEKIHSMNLINDELEKTINYWKSYINERTIPKVYGRDHVIRSILALKLLTYYESGAIVAAATTSIPEIIGTQRTWDYRYCWLRDASFAIDALTKVCSFEEAEAFLKFLMSICAGCVATGFNLGVLYGVEGKTIIREQTLRHLSGYKNSKPVRIGNAASKQIQIDVMGEIMDAVYEFFISYNYVEKMTDEQFNFLNSLVNQVIKMWKRKDSSIWEFRDIKKHFVFSKLMCWVALDRIVKIAEHYRKKCPLKKWKRIRDEIRKDILTKGWDEKKKSFTMYYGSKEVGAGLLLMYHYGFLSSFDEKYIGTVRAVERELVKDCLVYRYRMKDDFGRPRNPFIIASFWLIDALYAIGDKKKAIRMFKDMLKFSNHLGLFSEDIDIKTKELTGNFPQAYTHIALINSAILLSNKGIDKRPVCMPKLKI